MNIKYLYLILFFALLCASTQSCTEDEIDIYSSPAMVNYDYDRMLSIQIVKNFVEISFGFTTTQDSIIELKFLVVGYKSNTDRKIGYSIDSRSTAVANTHYELNEADFKIPAGQMSTTVSCKILRASLDEEQKSLRIIINDSPDFQAGFQKEYTIIMNDDIPSEWNSSSFWVSYYLGSCSKVKYKFLFDTLGIWDLIPYADDYSALGSIQALMKAALLEYEADNGYMYDENENRVTFP